MKFVTITGSIYELDLSARRLRRLEGKLPPTPRQGVDGEWREYASVSIPRVGSSLLTTWRVVQDGDGFSVMQMTATSKILSIEGMTEQDNLFLAQMALSLGQAQEAC